MEPPATDRIPPPAWAGRPPLLRALGDRYAEAVALCVVGSVAGAAAVVLAPDGLSALMTSGAVAAGVGAVATRIEVSDLRKAATEAPVTAEGPSRSLGRGDYVVAAPPWHLVGALIGLLASNAGSGEVDVIGYPVLVGAAGLLVGLGIAAWAGGRWVRRWERREHLTLYLRDVSPSRTADSAVTPHRAPTREEAARVQRKMMSGKGLDDEGDQLPALPPAGRTFSSRRATPSGRT